ncbi:MAG: ribosome small subunit-dependent GTPase A [Demequinaceae bacterium]|nr:ribosome small subunit-dependent GTPase A [Demequinaceae bacterium]
MRRFDESDARIRPNPRGSRPRSKRRPDHADALDGWVIAVDRGRYLVHGVGEDDVEVTAIQARELGKRAIVVGDRVRVVGDVSGEPGSLARIVGREERRGILRRSADDSDPTERVVVANATQLGIVTSLAEPEPNRRLIDRCLVAAFDAGIEGLLVLTKNDLGDPTPLRASYEPLGDTVVSTGQKKERIDGLPALREALSGGTTVLIGSSGVGKSTLVNALVPGSDRATGGVNEVTGRGRHTSSSAVALRLPDSGWIIDTPGIRTFGLGHVKPEHLLSAFPEVAEAATACSRGCPHLGDGDGCLLDAWADTAERRSRLESIRRLLTSRIGTEPL